MTNSPRSEDKLQLVDLQVSCSIGDTPEEKAFPQIVLVTIDIILPLQNAGKSDDLNQSVDYAEIMRQINEIAKTKSFNLLEAFAETIAERVLRDSRVHATRVRAAKKVFPELRAFAVDITRTQK